MIKEIKCKICNKYFEVEGQLYNGFFKTSVSPWNKKICSEKCRKQNFKDNAMNQAERNKEKIIKRKCRSCGKDVISTAYCPQSFCGGKSGECFKKHLSESRKGDKNPAYRNGFAVIGKRTYTGIHLRACSKYRKEFLKKHDYLYCEDCGINQNGTPKFEVHHIYFASLFPKHKELHNPKNLILLCIKCHNDYHSSKKKEKFIELEKDRGLKELFK